MKSDRDLKSWIENDLKTKMVFLGGPRQVGKTTLAKAFTEKKEQYLNWDFLDDRALIRQHRLNPELKLVILDEVHKYAKWRTLIKGFYDKYKDTLPLCRIEKMP